MPNHCYQQVHIHGPRFLVKEIYDSLIAEADPKFCQLICPMPFEQWLAPRTNLMGYEVEGWYDWRVTNWGTKWDVVDVDITQPLASHGMAPEDMTASFSFNCWTAWSPPIPVWDKLHEMGISVDADYQDEGLMFEGRWVDGKDECWEPEIEEEDA